MGSSKIYVHIRDEEIENIPGNLSYSLIACFIRFLVYEEVFSSDDEDEDENSKWFYTKPYPSNGLQMKFYYVKLFLDDLYDNIARNQEKENRRKKRTQTIDQYEEHTYTGPSSALILFGKIDSFRTMI